MANEFKIKKGLVVNGSGSIILDIQGSQGQLFSVTDSLSGSLFSVNDISGMPIMEVFSDNTIKAGTFGAEGLTVSESSVSIRTPIVSNSISITHIPVFTTNPTGSALIESITPPNLLTSLNAVPTSRTLTINGESFDLTANRTWNVGTVTSVATNNGITGGTITTTGTIGLTGQALALHNLATNGIISRTGSGTVAARTITGSTSISVSNGDGVSGNPTLSAIFGTTAGTIAQGNDSRFHNPVTIGTANGLSLSGQAISLGPASASTNGALTSTDWNTFNNKENTLTFSTGLSRTGNTIISTITQYTDALARQAISLTTSGNSGSSTYNNSTGVLNIPTYTLVGLGYTGALNADNYVSWNLRTNGVQRKTVTSSGIVDIVAGTNVTVGYSGDGVVTISSTDTNTTYTAGTGLALTGTVFSNTGVLSIAAISPILTSASTGTITLSHATSGVTAGTYNNVTVNATGHITAGSNISYLTAVDLGYTASTTNGIITNTGGTNATVPLVSTNAGLMSPTDKTKLDGIQAGAQVNVGTNLSIGSNTATVVRVDSSTGNNVNLPLATSLLAGIISSTDKTKLDGIEAGAQVNVGTNLGSSGTGGTRTITSSTGTNTSITYTAADLGALTTINLGYTAAASNGTVTNSGGTNAVIPAATTSLAGLLTSTDKTKLDGIATGATANTGTVTSVSALTLGTTGTDLSSTVANNTTTPVITLNVPTASATNRGVLSSADWTTFNNKAAVNQTMHVGTTALAINRASAAQTLTGVSIDGNAATVTNGVYTVGNQTIGGEKTFSGLLRGRVASIATSLTGLTANTPSFDCSEVTVPNSGIQYVPMIHGRSILSGAGYRQHISLGHRRTPTNWGDFYIAVGGNDNNPTREWLFNGVTGNTIFPGVLTASTFIGELNGNSSTVTNGVYTEGNQTINGIKTFSSTVNASTFNATSTIDGGFQGIAEDTVSTPSFTWTGALTTGMWRPTTTSIGFTIAGTNRATIDANGISGVGSGLTSLNAANISSGTLAIARGGTNSTATPTNGGISYGTGTAFAFSAAGTTGQYLRSAGASAPTWNTLTLEDLPDAWAKRTVRVATTANITLSGTQTIDGIVLVAADRVLVKNQTTASQNGIYIVSTGAWTRATDADTSSEIGAAVVAIDLGTVHGGSLWTTTFKAADTLGTTAMNWFEVLYNSGTWGISITGNSNTATTLANTRTLWGRNFNGGANVTGALSSVTTIAMTGQLTSTLATGTAPFAITSTTRVANLNVATAGTADTWTTGRTITIGSTGKSVNGSANISWTLAEIGAAAASHTHAASQITAGTFGTGNYVFPGNVTMDGQIHSTVNAKGNSGTGTVTFSWNDANIQSVTLTGNCTFAFSNPLSGASYQIIITQDATGGRTITFPTIRWEGGTVPSLTGTANSQDIVTLTYDGTNYYGVISKNHKI
jgi:hypothetical protein